MKRMSSADRLAAVVIAALALFMMLGVRAIFHEPLAVSAVHTGVAHPYMP